MKLGRGESHRQHRPPRDEELEGIGDSFKAIREKLASRSLGRLMAGVTHEVRNPSQRDGDSSRAGARASAAAAAPFARCPRPQCWALTRRRATRDLDGAREHIDVISSEIKRLDEVITGFVRFIHPEELQLQPVSAESLINEVIALVEPDVTSQRRRLPRSGLSRMPELRGDPALLRQALLNLALNGLPGHAPRRQIDDGASQEKDRRIALTIEDTGTGIPAGTLDKISTCISRQSPRAAAWVCRSCIAWRSSTGAKLRSSPRRGAERPSGC
jgi:signal transduction histidine kinase